MGGRDLPIECEHGIVIDGGDFMDGAPCADCEAGVADIEVKHVPENADISRHRGDVQKSRLVGVGSLFTVAITRTHPADVTADRLIKQYEQWYDKFTQRELDDIGNVINALREIAGGSR